MSDPQMHDIEVPPEQQAIRAKCFHPSGTYLEFPMRDVEISIPARFEKIAKNFPSKVAVGAGANVLTYAELNFRSNQIARAIRARDRSRPSS